MSIQRLKLRVKKFIKNFGAKIYFILNHMINLCIILFLPELVGLCYFIIMIFLTVLGMKYIRLFIQNIDPRINLIDLINNMVQFYSKIESLMNKIDFNLHFYLFKYNEFIYSSFFKPFIYKIHLLKPSSYHDLVIRDYLIFAHLFLFFLLILVYFLIVYLGFLDKCILRFGIKYYLSKEKQKYFQKYVIQNKKLSKERYWDLVDSKGIYPKDTIFYCKSSDYDLLEKQILEFNSNPEKRESWLDMKFRENLKLLIYQHQLKRLAIIFLRSLKDEEIR